MTVRFLSLLFCLHFFAILTKSQSYFINSEKYIVKQFSNKNGLDQESIVQIIKDNNGLIWIANNSGCVRFDGITFKDFSLPGNKRIIGMYKKNGNRDSIYIFDSDENKFIIRDGKIWQAPNLPDSGLVRSSKLHEYKLFTLSKKNYNNFKSILDKNGIVPDDIYSDNGKDFYYYNRYRNNLIYQNGKISKKFNFTSNLPSPSFGFLLNDTFYILKKGMQLLRFYKEIRLPDLILKNKFTKHFFSILEKKLNLTPPLLFNRNKRILHYDSNSLFELKYENEDFKVLTLYKNIPKISDITDIIIDEEWNYLFIASSVQGLFLITKRNFYTQKSNLGIPLENNIRAIMPIGEDSILSARNAILFTKNTTKQIKKYLNESYAIVKDNYNSLYLSQKGKKSPYLTQLFKYNSNKKQIIKLPNSNIDYAITSGFISKSGDVYISDYKHIYKIQNDSAILKLKIPATDDAIFSFGYNYKGDLFVGTYHYLFKYSANMPHKRDTLLKDHAVRTIFFDNYKIWVGTYGQGIYVIDSSSNIHKIPLDKNSNLLFTHSFIKDSNNYMWSSTNNGLYRYATSSIDNYLKDKTSRIRYYKFDYSDGFETNEFNGGVTPCAIRDSKGNVLLSSISGIVKFKPEDIILSDNKYDIIIDRIIVDSISFDPEKKLQFPSNTSTIQLNVTTSKFAIEKDNSLEYQIDGNPNWYHIESSGNIIFNKLATGKYKLTIRKPLNKNFKTKKITFEILPHFYEKTSFILLCISIICLFAYLYYRLRINRLKKIQAQLEEIVKEKTASLSDTVEVLNSTIDQLSISSKNLNDSYTTIQKVTEIVLHDLRSPLKYQKTIAQHLLKERHTLSEKEIENYLLLLSNSSSRNAQFANDLLSWLILNTQGISSKKTTINLNEFISDLIILYRDLALEKNSEMIYENSTDIIVKINNEVLSIILRNVLDNSIKHTTSGKITIKYSFDLESVRIFISDTGKGFNIKDYFDSGKFIYKKENSSLGLKIIDELTEKIGAQYTFTSTMNVGTTFTLIIPLIDEV